MLLERLHAPQSILSETKRYQLASYLEPSRALPCHRRDFLHCFITMQPHRGWLRWAAGGQLLLLPGTYLHLLLKRLAWRPINHLGRPQNYLGQLKDGRGTICQELRGYGCMSLRAGEWEAPKDFESQSLSSFLWFCDNQRLSQ